MFVCSSTSGVALYKVKYPSNSAIYPTPLSTFIPKLNATSRDKAH